MRDRDRLREATPGDIHNAFRMLGVLLGAEKHEQDEQGTAMVKSMLRRLKQFRAHEQAEHHPAREASYGENPKVWYDGGDAIRDASDLYTVLSEEHRTGSPNLENMQAKQIVDHLQRGGGLGEMQIGILRRLLAKHQGKIDQLRTSRDRDGQDILNVPEGSAHERIIGGGQA